MRMVNVQVDLHKDLIAKIKTLANKKDVPYQSLMKVYLAERVEKELRSKTL